MFQQPSFENNRIVPPSEIKRQLDPRERARKALAPVEMDLKKMLASNEITPEDIEELLRSVAEDTIH